MENICFHLKYGIYVIFVTNLYLSSGYDSLQVEIPWEEQTEYETVPVVVCPCKPCMTGPQCQDKVNVLNPRFSQRYYYIELSDEYKPGTPLLYNSTTYPGGKDCPCVDFEYMITGVRNAMEDRDGSSEENAVFSVNKNTGEISINRPLKAFEFYKMTVAVRNKITNQTDEARISVALEPPTRRINRYSPEIFNGYEDDEEDEFSYSHHISKRSVIDPAEMNFTLSVNGDTSAVKVGSKLEFTLDIIFPSGSVDMLVELFTPDNETTVMILCNVAVASIGSNLTPGVGTPTVVMDSNDNSTQYDRAIIDFGIVSNSEADTVDITSSTITITYEAIMILNGATVDGNVYWVSAGAEYDNENKIWVGQASTTVDTADMTVTDSATFNVGLPSNMALGSSSLVPVDMFLPYPSSTYTFNVFTPLNTSGVMSVCAVMYKDVAQNFGCGNDMAQVTQALTADNTSVGNSQGTVNLGNLLNKGSRDASPVTADNRVTVYFVIHLYPNADLVGTTQTVAITLEVDTSTIWVGNTDVTVDAAVTTGFTNPVFVSLTTDLTALTATIGEPFKVLVDISIPAPSTPGVATPYVLEVLAPFSTTAIFKLCSLEIVSVGRDLPCVNKDELVPTYHSSATPAGALADRGTLDMGYVMNIDHYQGAGDDIIQIQAIFTPNSDHPSAIDASSHTITFGATVGKTSPTSVVLATESISLSGTATVTPISNATAPSFTMSYYDSGTNAQADEVSVLESTKVLIDMTTTRNVMYDKMDIEWLMQLATDSPYMHVCKAEIETAGKNLPCLTPEWTNTLIEYESKFDNDYMDRGSMYVGSLCNKEMVNDVAEDDAKFALYLKVLDLPSVNDMDEFWVSMGLMYSSSQLWVGQLKLKARRGESISPAVTPEVGLSKNSTMADIPLGYYAVYSLLLKVPPGDRTDLEITATVDKPGLDVCSIRVASVGTNLPCVTDELAPKTYVPQSATLDLDIVTNFGSGSLNSNDFFDSDSLIVEVLLKADTAVAADTYQLDVTSYFDTGKTVSDTKTQTGITTTADLSGIDTTITTVVTGTLTVGEIAGNDTDLNIAVGETKRILFSLVIPDESIYDLTAAVTIPAAHVGKLELGDAAIYSAGKNLRCIDKSMAPTITSVGGVYNDNAEFTLGYVCNRPVKPGDTAANTLTIEAWVRLLPNSLGSSAVGSTVTVAGSVVTFGGSSVTVDTLDLTATDPATFMDKIKSLTGVTNATLISINQASPFSMAIGENKTIEVTVTVPTYSVSRFLFDVELPNDGQTACMTVIDVTVTSTVGANIPCFAPDSNKGISFAPNYTSALGTSQMTNGYQDLGIITNTGKTHRLGTNVAGDDDIVIEVTIQMADCAGASDGSTHVLSLGNKIASVIFIYDNDVTVSRDTLEKPDFVFTLTGTVVSSSLINIDGELYHSASSTAEGYNTSIVIACPEYLIAPTTLVTASLSSYTIITDPATPYVLDIFFNNFFFTDYFTFRAAISVNTSDYIPSAETTIYSAVGTDFVPRSSNYSADDWFPYVINDGTTITVDLDPSSGDSCTIVALGLGNNAIEDCQIRGSPDFLPSYPPRYGKKNSGSAWKPGIRDGTLARKKYFQVFFGNVVQIYQIEVSQTVSVDLATELLIDYSNDGEAWFDPETIDLGPTPSTSETVVLKTVVEARYARIKITNDTNNLVKAEPALNFEFYGCIITSDVPDPCASIPTTVSRPADFYTRSFIEDPVNGYVFVCDSDGTSSMEEGRCHMSTDGNSWNALDERLGSLIGFEQDEKRLYGYDNNKETVLVSTDYGITWLTADVNKLATDKLQSWTDAKEVPLDTSLDLDQPTPSNVYTFNAYGATYTGLYENNNLEQKWSSQ